MKVILLTAMEYLREEVVEEEEGAATETCKIETTAVGGNLEEAETQFSSVTQPMEAWPEQFKKINWVDRIKTLGLYSKLNQYFTISHFRNKGLALHCYLHWCGLWCNCGNILFQLK